MKRFSFSLQKLLNYKGQLFDIELSVLTEMRSVLSAFETELESLRLEHKQRSAEFNAKAAVGTTVTEIQTHKIYLKMVDESIEHKQIQIRLQKLAIEKQADKVREAKIDISIMEKLKEKKLEEYDYLAAKAQELFIEEFVSNAKATALREEGTA